MVTEGDRAALRVAEGYREQLAQERLPAGLEGEVAKDRPNPLASPGRRRFA